MYLKLLYPLLILLLLVACPFLPPYLDIFTIVVLLSLVAFTLILFAIRKESINNLKGQYLKHSNLILIGIVIVHFQYPLDFVLGNISENDWFIWINHSIVVESLCYSTIGLISLLLGYLSFWEKKKSLNNSSKSERAFSTKVLMWFAGVLLAAYFATVNPLYLAGHYGSEAMGPMATYIILLFKVVVFAVLIQNSRNAIVKGNIPASFLDYARQQNYFLIFLIIIYLLSVMFSGDRGPIITFGIAFVSGYYFVTKRKLSFQNAVILVFVGAFFMTLLGVARNLDKSMSFSDRITESVQTTKFDNKSILPQTTELAWSIRTLHAVVNYIPEHHAHTWGRFQFQQIMASIPFSWHAISLLFDEIHFRFKGPASFVTWVMQGDSHTYGVGTTCIADFYAEFGLVGVILGMFLLGYLLRFSEIRFYTSEFPALFPHIFSFVYLSNAIYISRSSASFGFRTVIWIYVVMYMNKTFLSRKWKL